MATVIQIKRTTGATAPTTSNLSEAELAYVEDRSNDGASSKSVSYTHLRAHET